MPEEWGGGGGGGVNTAICCVPVYPVMDYSTPSRRSSNTPSCFMFGTL